MRGVDLADQALWYNLNVHKTVKWWKKIVFALVEICFTNTLAIYKAANPRLCVERSKVRMKIINKLVSGCARRAYQKGPAVQPAFAPDDVRLDMTLEHLPETLTQVKENGTKEAVYLDCIVCSDRAKKRHKSKFQCSVCKKPLCPAPCFTRNHTVRNGWKKSCVRKEGENWVFDESFHI